MRLESFRYPSLQFWNLSAASRRLKFTISQTLQKQNKKKQRAFNWSQLSPSFETNSSHFYRLITKLTTTRTLSSVLTSSTVPPKHVYETRPHTHLRHLEERLRPMHLSLGHFHEMNSSHHTGKTHFPRKNGAFPANTAACELSD